MTTDPLPPVRIVTILCRDCFSDRVDDDGVTLRCRDCGQTVTIETKSKVS